MNAHGLAPLAWPQAHPPGAAARRWACHALYSLAVQLDAAGDAHALLRHLLADTDQGRRPGRLAPRLALIDDAAVPAGPGVDLLAVLNAQGHDDAAAELARARRRRRAALQALRGLADLDQRGLLDPGAARDCLRYAAGDLAAFGRGVAQVDQGLLAALTGRPTPI